MAINYRKIKSQIKRLAPEAKHDGYIFIATDEQKNDFIVSMVTYNIRRGNARRRLIEAVASLANTDIDYAKHFKL